MRDPLRLKTAVECRKHLKTVEEVFILAHFGNEEYWVALSKKEAGTLIDEIPKGTPIENGFPEDYYATVDFRDGPLGKLYFTPKRADIDYVQSFKK